MEDQQEKRTIVLNYNDFLILFIFPIYEGCISTNVMKRQLGPHSKLTNQNLCGFCLCVSHQQSLHSDCGVIFGIFSYTFLKISLLLALLLHTYIMFPSTTK